MVNSNSRGSGRPSLAMVLQEIFQRGFSSVRGGQWQHLALYGAPVVIGALALTTTLLLGSFLWGYMKKTKNPREKFQPLEDLYPPISHKPNTVLTMHDFIKSPCEVHESEDNSAYFDTLVFDTEQDYAQVLAEAKTHSVPKTPAPAAHRVSHSPKWLPRSQSARHHNPFLEDLEAMFPQPKVQDKSKVWKKLLFWKKSKKEGDGGSLEPGSGFTRSCSTPVHHAFRSKTRASVAPTSSTSGTSKSKRANSGPVYSDGMPFFHATRPGRQSSGPLSGGSTPSREGLYESAYMALKKQGYGAGAGAAAGAGMANKSPSAQLYVT